MDKMSSHTARYASVRALWYEVSGDLDSRERAFRSFYSVEPVAQGGFVVRIEHHGSAKVTIRQ